MSTRVAWFSRQDGASDPSYEVFCVADEKNLKGCVVHYATLNSENKYFWNTAIYDGEDSSHFFFIEKGQLLAVLRTAVVKIEFTSAASAAGRRV